jgi:sRNA-binding protein
MISSSSTTRRAPTSRRPAPSWHRSRSQSPLGLRSTEAAIKGKPVPTAAAAAAPRPRQPLSATAIGAMLIERFPQCFVLARDRKRPLKIGIHRDLIAAIPEVPPKRLRAALGWYAGSWAYLKNMTAGAARIDLNGQSAGEVTAEEAAAAAERRASEKAAYFVAKKAARERK